MGIKQANQSAATTKNIEHALGEKNLTKSALAAKAGIAQSTFYRNLGHPEKFTLREIGLIADALDLPLTDLLKDAA